jgi:precorrin-2 dehydrogenase/sirohydrochlorin ferrochelatase
MLPISVDLGQIRVMLVGGGKPALRRLRALEEAGAGALDIYAPDPEPALAAAAGARLRARFPTAAEIARTRLVFVAGAAESVAAEISRMARAAGVLVNVEDDRARSDFHSAAIVRRGDLTLAISTNGKSPGLAALLKRILEQRFGPEWGMRLEGLSALRQSWRAAGADPAAISERTRQWAWRQGWLGPSHEPPAPIP